MNTKAEAAREEEDKLDAPADDDGERILSQADWILEVESFWHHRDDIRLGLGTALSSIKRGGVLIGFVLISTSGKKLDLLEVFRPRRGACDEGITFKPGLGLAHAQYVVCLQSR